MTVALVGAAKVTPYSTPGTVTPPFNQTPTAGNLLLMGVMAGEQAPSCTTPTGWTAGPTGTASIPGNAYVSIFLFWKVAVGGDAAPSVTIGSGTYPYDCCGVLIEEWSGLNTTPHDANSTVGTNNQDSTAAGTCNSGPLTTTSANDWIWSFMGAWAANSTVLTWGGGSTADAMVYPSSVEVGTATQTTSSVGTYTPTLAFAASTTWFGSATASMAFKLAITNPNASPLNSPPTGAALDLGVTNRFGWTFSSPSTGDSQSKFDLQYRLSSTMVAAPVITLGTAATGGTFAAGSYFWKLTAINAAGETTGSNEVTATLALNDQQPINWTAVAGATEYKLYRGTAAGAENVLVATLGAVVTYTDTGTAGTAATVPTANTTAAWTPITGTTPNSFWDAVAETFTAAAYEWQVRTYGSTGLVGPWSASSFFTAANSPSGATITAPTSGSTVVSTATLTWSTPNQTDWQYRRVADNAGAADTTTIYYASGDVIDGTTRSLSAVAFPVNSRWEHVQVRVKYAGLWSTWTDCRVYVSWTLPNAPALTATAFSISAEIDVAITNPPVPAVRTNLAINSRVAVDTTGWTAGATRVAQGTGWACAFDGSANTYMVSPSTTSTGGEYYSFQSVVNGPAGRTITVEADDGIRSMGVTQTITLTGSPQTVTLLSNLVALAGGQLRTYCYMQTGWLAGDQFTMTNVLIEEVSGTGVALTGPYFDGSTANTSAVTHAWTGTANASTSTETSTTPVTSYNDVYVSSPLDPEYRAATLVPPNSTWPWKTPAAGRLYTIRVVAVGSNGTTASS